MPQTQRSFKRRTRAFKQREQHIKGGWRTRTKTNTRALSLSLSSFSSFCRFAQSFRRRRRVLFFSHSKDTTTTTTFIIVGWNTNDDDTTEEESHSNARKNVKRERESKPRTTTLYSQQHFSLWAQVLLLWISNRGRSTSWISWTRIKTRRRF